MFEIIHQLHQNKETMEKITKRPIEVTYQSLLFNFLDELFEHIFQHEFIQTEELLTSKYYQHYIQKKMRDIVQKYPLLTEETEKKIIKEDFHDIIHETLAFQELKKEDKELYKEGYKRELRTIFLFDFIDVLGKYHKQFETCVSIEKRNAMIVPLIDSFYILYKMELSKKPYRYPNKEIDRRHPTFVKAREVFAKIINLYGSEQLELEETLKYLNVSSYFKENEIYSCQKNQEEYYVFKVIENKGSSIGVEWVEKKFLDHPSFHEIENLFQTKEMTIKKVVLKIKETTYLKDHFKLVGHLS